jgi:flagellar motility protein MotE (MotC chaperone)
MRLLPLLIMVAVLALTMRIGNMVVNIRSLPGVANAADQKINPNDLAATAPEAGEKASDKEGEKDAAPNKKEAAVKTDSEKVPDGAGPDTKKESIAKEDAKTPEKSGKDQGVKPVGAAAWPDATDMDPDLEKVKAQLFKDLSTRRTQLDEREKQIAMREAILKAAQSELEQKYQELNVLSDQIKGLLNQQSEEEITQMKSLVKIYEGMKPADAARILNTLDINVLLDVMTEMSVRKSSAIIAAMDPDRARVLTLMMAQQKRLPELPELTEPQAGDPQDDASDITGEPVTDLVPPPPPAIQ